MLKKFITTALVLGSVTLANVALVAPAQAGEGHWSIGKGVQCKIVLGVVVCGKTRP